MLKIRLQRHGAKHAPFYRMVVTEVTAPRDGRFIEILGTYDPQCHAKEDELKLKMDRIDHWLGVGAQLGTSKILSILVWRTTGPW